MSSLYSDSVKTVSFFKLYSSCNIAALYSCSDAFLSTSCVSGSSFCISGEQALIKIWSKENTEPKTHGPQNSD